MEMAGQQHVVNVMAGAVVEFPHVKRSRLEIVKVSFELQALQHALLHKVYVPDLIPGNRKIFPFILHANVIPFNLSLHDESAVS